MWGVEITPEKNPKHYLREELPPNCAGTRDAGRGPRGRALEAPRDPTGVRGWGPPAPRSPGAARSVRPARSWGSAGPRMTAIVHLGEPGHGESSRRSPFPACLRAHRCPTSGRERRGAVAAVPGVETSATGRERTARLDGPTRTSVPGPALRRSLQDGPGRTAGLGAVQKCRRLRLPALGKVVAPGRGSVAAADNPGSFKECPSESHILSVSSRFPGEPRTPPQAVCSLRDTYRPYLASRPPWPAPVPASPRPCGTRGPGAAAGPATEGGRREG